MWPNPQFPEDLVALTEEILNGKVHFSSSESPDYVHFWVIFSIQNVEKLQTFSLRAFF